LQIATRLVGFGMEGQTKPSKEHSVALN